MALGIDDQLDVTESDVSDISFASAEARYALLRARRMRLVLHIVGMAVVLLAALAFAVVVHASRQTGSGIVDALRHDSGPPQSLNIDPVGSPDAKVQVVAVLPTGSDCHSGVAKFLSDVATLHPDQIRVEYKSLDEFSETELSSKVGQVCAAILINDTANFTLDKNGKSTAVSLVGNEPTNYKMSDVGDALTQVYTTQYGAPDAPLYQIEQKTKCGTCPSDVPSEDSHDQHGAPGNPPSIPETKEAAEVVLPGKLPAIKGLD